MNWMTSRRFHRNDGELDSGEVELNTDNLQGQGGQTSSTSHPLDYIVIRGKPWFQH